MVRYTRSIWKGGMMGSSTYQGASHLIFRRQPLEKGAKLHKYMVMNSKFNSDIGFIHWRGGWRQYVFDDGHIILAEGCLYELFEFIKKLREDRESKLLGEKE